MITKDIDKLASALFARQYREEQATSERRQAENSIIGAMGKNSKIETDSWIIERAYPGIKLIAK